MNSKTFAFNVTSSDVFLPFINYRMCILFHSRVVSIWK